MTSYAFRIVNVFTIGDDRFSGNPLCVFEDARALDDASMQALALQFNLSETTFVMPSEMATARMRIFTPMFEMPFAGHPTLGTAHVVRACTNSGGALTLDALTLEMKAGIIPVTASGDDWTLEANAPTTRDVDATPDELAAMLGLVVSDVLPGARWVNTGSEQLVIPLRSIAAVDRCMPVLDLLRRHGHAGGGRYLAYVFAEADTDTDTDTMGNAGEVSARFFFPKGTSVVEDPATGSACANLGGYYLAQGAELPLFRRVRQGAAVKRPSELRLRVEPPGRIFVSGRVVELGRGVITLPDPTSTNN